MRRFFVMITSFYALFVGLIVAGADPAGATGHSPVGHVDAVHEASPAQDFDGRTYVSGWAADPDLTATSGLTIRFYVDGQYTAATSTHLSRPDVARVYPRYGGNTGCSSVTQSTHGYLQGHLDSITVISMSPLTVTFTGWGLDPTDHTSMGLNLLLGVKNYEKIVDSDLINPLAKVKTSLPRPDVVRAYPGHNPNSGFRVVWTQKGSPTFHSGQSICVYLNGGFFAGSLSPYAQAPVCTSFP